MELNKRLMSAPRSRSNVPFSRMPEDTAPYRAVPEAETSLMSRSAPRASIHSIIQIVPYLLARYSSD